MSIFQKVNNYFLLKSETIEEISALLTHYKTLINNRRSTDSIDLQINKWTKSTAENNPENLNNKASLAWLKLKDGMCDDITSFSTTYFDTFIKYTGLSLLQGLIDKYAIDANIVKNALLNLIQIVKLLSEIDSIRTIPWHRLVFKKKMDNIAGFINSKMHDFIYREVYIAYLVQQRDSKLLNHPRLYSTNSVVAVCKKNVTKVMLLSNNMENMILHPYITKMDDINCIRLVSKDLYLHYNSETMKGIAVQNLKDIINNFFMINVDEFTTALLSCGAILGGSIVAQSFHGSANTVFRKSDANIYVPIMNNYFAIEELILKSGYELYTTSQPSLLEDNSYFYSSDVSCHFNSSILFVRNYKNKMGRKVQVTIVRCPANVVTTYDFGQFVVNFFDLTFLQNFFDGITLYTHDFHGVVRKIGSITSFIKRICTFNDSTAKYPELLRNWYSIVTTTTIRCLQYQQCGFQIDGVPELSLVTELGIL